MIEMFKRKGQDYKIKERIIITLGDLVNASEKGRSHIKALSDIQYAMTAYINYIAKLPNPKAKEINGGIRYAIETIGKTSHIDRERNIVRSLKEWLKEASYYPIRFAILYTIGKLRPVDSELYRILAEFLNKNLTKSLIIPLLWAIGQQGTRETAVPVPIDYLGESYRKILDKMEIQDFAMDYEVIRYAVYALWEITMPCKINPKNCCQDNCRQTVISALEKKFKTLKDTFDKKSQTEKEKEYPRYLQAGRFINVVISYLKGDTANISPDDMELLREIREKN